MARQSITMLLLSSLLWHHARSFGTTLPKRRVVVFKSNVRNTFSSTTSSLFAVSEQDEAFLAQAVEHARNGFGKTFPNPAVGCVLVNQNTNEVIGSGFHPRAGFPHAEVFALLEAAGHVESGVESAKSVVQGTIDESLQSLASKYASQGGPEELLGETLASMPVTAYVTLEPCCHYGQTPPCAASLALSKVNRVVVGFRDPNPRVDGGGVKLLREAGIDVDMADGDINQACADIVDCFVKRITPKDYEQDYSHMNGAMRSALRRLAGVKKGDDSLAIINWTSKTTAADDEGVDALGLAPKWMERVDAHLWKDELVSLRLNKAVKKKKMARRLGERIAESLGAHVAQTVGHTVLLYRPGIPPVLDLEQLVEEGRGNGEDEQLLEVDQDNGEDEES
jgi:pyrimidine deaminase RibD-like protein/RNA-binding protein YhbY